MTNATEPCPHPRSVPGRPQWRRAIGAVLLAGGLTAGGASCSLDGLLNSDQLPKNVSDPAITETARGARAAYVGTLNQFRTSFGSVDGFVLATGLLSDELHILNSPLDQRTMPEPQSTAENGLYSNLQKVRGQANQALGLLAAYVPEQPALRGHLYALQGYAEIFLAELFCSGIPLSTLDFNGDFTYKPGSTTAEVLTHAATLFDTALTLVGDNARFVQLAQMGRGRVLLNLGRYADAAVAVAAIPNDYQYDVTFASSIAMNFAGLTQDQTQWLWTVPNQEGFNGLDWRTSGDPRTTVTDQGGTVYHPDKYDTDGSSPIVLASGVEARLIEAEAALQASPDDGVWLTKLNALRTDGTFELRPTTDPNDDPSVTYPHWHAGTGGVDSLPPLDDPADPTARVDLLFRERAFWLFLTGHRQGDLRRLIRQYGSDPRFYPDGLDQSDVYPVGPDGPQGPYGGDVTVPIPVSEISNPLFTGCASRGA